MKKITLAITVLLASFSSFSQCTDIFFSEYQEGYNNNKYLELYNPTNSNIDLSLYRIVRWDNGNTASDADVRYVQPLVGTINAHDTWTCFLDRRVTTATAADTILWTDLLTIANNTVTAGKGAFYSPDYNASTNGARVLSFNGDDAFSIQKNVNSVWTNIDIFGAIGDYPVNGSGNHSPNGAWTDTSPYNTGLGAYLTKDKTLIRKASVQQGVSTNPTTFNALAEYDSLPVHSYSNIGLHTCACATSVAEVTKDGSFSVYPNPSGKQGFVVNGNKAISVVNVYDVLGNKIACNVTMLGATSCSVSMNTQAAGVYLLKIISSDGSVSTQSHILQ